MSSWGLSFSRRLFPTWYASVSQFPHRHHDVADAALRGDAAGEVDVDGVAEHVGESAW